MNAIALVYNWLTNRLVEVNLRTERCNSTELIYIELNPYSLVFFKLTNGQEGKAHWSLADAYVSVVK